VDPLIDNYCALAVVILNPNHSIDTAIDYFSDKQVRKIDISVAAEMARLKETMTYKQIGKLYNISADAVFKRIKRFKRGI
jgi:hypothetical protein